MDMSAMENLVWQFFTRETAKLPSEARQALGNLVVEIARLPNQVVIRTNPNDPASEKAAQVVLNSVIQPLSQICAAFGTKVEVFK